MVYMRSEKSICAPHCVSDAFPTWPLKRFQCSSDDAGPLTSFQGRSSSASSLRASLLQAIDDAMSLALCPQVVSQAPQHFRSSENCFASQSICSFIFLHSGMSRTVHLQEVPKVDVESEAHSSLGFPFHFSLFVANSWNL